MREDTMTGRVGFTKEILSECDNYTLYETYVMNSHGHAARRIIAQFK